MTKLDKSTLEDEWVNQVEQLSENAAGDAITNNENQATSDEELVDTVNESLTHDAEDDAVLAREDYEDVKVLHDNVTPELSSVNENVSEQELPVNETMLTPKDNSLNQEPSTNETQSTPKDDASRDADLLTANETNQQTAATSTKEEYDWSTGKDSTNNYQAIEKAAWEADRKHKIDKGSPYEFHYIASAHRRVVAFLIDSLVITGLINLFFSMWSFTSLINFGISTAIYCLYFAGLTLIFKGQTLGKMIMGLRTVRLDGYNLKLSDIFFREIVSRIIQRPYPFLYLISFFTSEKKQIGDWVANTCVIVDFE
ncbi:RDD family protein [Globicatella sp. PHS-GS-PNBC-21-1553]|uniref:RDD family protein n=1 Tax=Globicatella sp. PHS-GS-PNBC-21-1553 TaxID=2885764 RepID=UPI00298EDDEC|nr:RDD family protein [Globicatella sp. PHS-GS-PNBC-21-1553]WPC09183.1 RDD family protein [Globicatella sp. PHS-GS-PNBC-21-1553]